MKTCNKCQTPKPFGEFDKRSKSKEGRAYTCKQCRQMYRLENRNVTWEKNMIARYGLTSAEYSATLKEQSGVCKICRQLCVTGRKLAVDHCHSTGKVRGLLCAQCNTGLGKAEDSIDRLNDMIKYLKEVK